MVVVGSGVAGLAVALAIAPTPVRVLCRTPEGMGTASALAQGGLAAAIDSADSAAAHAHDTLLAGAHNNHPAMVQWLCAQAPASIDWLQAQGVAFDRDAHGQLRLGREGGHRAARIVHAGGDATGAALVQALRQRVHHASHVQWFGGVEVEALLLHGDAVAGVRVRDAHGRRREMHAADVVLATGGIGALFARTSNPPGADGNGLALGVAAGASLRDLEFVQFHPTALDLAGVHCLPLITEALRGAGARLLQADGQPLMVDIHPLGDLAPRDVVARQVWLAAREQGQVWLDARGLGIDWDRSFPTVLAACLAHGIDPRLQPIPVTPAAHFHMGGLAVDADGHTGIAGLHAVGEVACNGVHGANRLASNSLLEGVCCGRRLGTLLAGRQAAPGHGVFRWAERGKSLPAEQLTDLRELLWRAAGPLRCGQALQQALGCCAALTRQGWQAGVAQSLLAAALTRRASLGAHYREDTAQLA